MARSRAADDFEAIRARLEELQRERPQAARGDAAEPVDETDRYPRRRSPQPAVNATLTRLRELLTR